MRVLILAAFGAAFFMPAVQASEPEQWRASAVICPLAMPGKCLVLEDKRTQATEGECKERARAILRNALPHVGPVLRAGTLCELAETEGQAA